MDEMSWWNDFLKSKELYDSGYDKVVAPHDELPLENRWGAWEDIILIANEVLAENKWAGNVKNPCGEIPIGGDNWVSPWTNGGEIK